MAALVVGEDEEAQVPEERDRVRDRGLTRRRGRTDVAEVIGQDRHVVLVEDGVAVRVAQDLLGPVAG